MYNDMVEARSEVARGSNFTGLLPQSDRSSTNQQEGRASSCSGKERILFVDDETELLFMTKTMLERIGCRVTALADASEALKVFAGNPDSFDLIITDQTMPDMTGVALAKEVLSVRKDIPIILCTGDREAVSQEEAREVGIRDFVIKPFTKKELAQTIHRVLEQGENIK